MSEMSKQLPRFSKHESGFILCTDEKIFTVIPMNMQNVRVYASVTVRKRNVNASPLLCVHTPYVQPKTSDQNFMNILEWLDLCPTIPKCS